MGGVSSVLGSLTEKFSDDSKPDKLTREIVRSLLRRLDDVKKGKDPGRPGSEDKCFITVVSQFQKTLQQQRYRPTGTINDMVINFLKASEAELRKNDPNPAVWYDQLNRYIARFAELVMRTVQEDAPSSATPELLEKLNHFVSPKSTRRHSDRRKPTPSSSPGALPADGSVEAFENFSMVRTVQNLFQVSDEDHRRKIQELLPICTESVSYGKKEGGS